MKYVYLILAAALLATSASAQTGMTREQMESRHQERVQMRDARHQTEIKQMDSIVLNRYYKFMPTSFQQEPAGNMHQIYSIMYSLAMYKDYVDIDIPYIVGVVAPYHLTIMNYITFDIQKYTAVQNEDGWTISFSSNLYSDNTYVYVQNLLDHPRGRAEHRFDPLSDGDLLRFDPADLLNFGEKTS